MYYAKIRSEIKFTKICLVRHAEIKRYVGELIPDAVGISAKGKKTAKKVAEYLKNENVTVVYSSPIARASETAEVVAKALGVDHITMKQFTERKGVIPRTPLEQEWADNYLNLDYRNGKVETISDFYKANYEGLDLIIKENMLKETKEKEQTLVVVAHSSNLYAFNAYFNKLPLKGKAVWLQCSNGAVVKFRV